MERRLLVVMVLTAALALMAGCGGGGGGGNQGPPGTGNAIPPSKVPVSLLLSSTANAQLPKYTVTLTGITLTNTSGNSVNVLSTTQKVELMHLNGSVESLLTMQVPQDTYTAATVTLSDAGFSCVALDSTGTLHVATFTPAAPTHITVTLPKPITISGTRQALLLNLLASQSASYPNCLSDTLQGFAATPAFELSTLDLSAQPTNSSNGKATGVDGQITSIATHASSFNIMSGDGISWSVSTSGSTVFQGIAGPSSLVTGMAVDLDAAIQTDGTLLATRVEVDDPNSTDLTTWRGPVLLISSAEPVFMLLPVSQNGTLFASSVVTGPWSFDFGNASFQMSAALHNIQSLPFAAAFDATNMVAGQNLYISTHLTHFPNSPANPAATTVTLLPQTLDGTITNISTEGGFSTYTITLAGYDPFVMLASQPGQTTLLQTPGTVIVYTDGSTQMLNTNPPGVGSVLRFNGLVFNDHGTLRMDCAEVLDGVAL